MTQRERPARSRSERSTSTRARGRRAAARSGFWAVAFAFLIVMAFATLPSPLYGLYRIRDHLSAFTMTVVYAIFAAGTIAALLSVRFVAARIGRRGVMLGAVATMMVASGLLAAWKALPGLLIGRVDHRSGGRAGGGHGDHLPDRVAGSAPTRGVGGPRPGPSARR